jgi:hypothetical protein
MRFSATNCGALSAIGALIDPTSAIYAASVSVTPHTTCSFVASIDVAKPTIARPEVAPIPVARVEIASVEGAGKEKGGADTSTRRGAAAVLNRPAMSVAVSYWRALRARHPARNSS